MKHLVDVNILVALTDDRHIHHTIVKSWFDSSGSRDWGVCAFTEAGFLRVTSNPKAGMHTVAEATRVLATVAEHPGYRFWPVAEGWISLAAPFVDRIYGHKQITDAYLLGLAVKENGVLVTLDRAIRFLAGPEHSRNLLVLE